MVWVNIIAVIVAPIVAVVIWQKLQDRTEKHFYFYYKIPLCQKRTGKTARLYLPSGIHCLFRLFPR
jgi:hypothetical protein